MPIGTRAALLSSLVLLGCGVREIDPPKEPGRAPIDVPVERIPAVRPPETGRVAIDAAGASMRVDEVIDMAAGFEMGHPDGTIVRVGTTPLCTATPCVADFGYGHHILRFSSTKGEGKVSFAPLRVDRGKITIVRHAPGYSVSHPGLQGMGSAALFAGVPMAFLGIVAFGVGQTDVGGDQGADVRSSVSTAGAVLLGVGLTLTAFGAALKIIGREEFQPGATTQFEEPEPTPTPIPVPNPNPTP
jgi:hypothetical protein